MTIFDLICDIRENKERYRRNEEIKTMPSKIKVKIYGEYYYYSYFPLDYGMCEYFNDESGERFLTDISSMMGWSVNCFELNVEIIEEPKEIEKFINIKIADTTISGLVKSLNMLHEDYANKINTIIDYLNQKENK